MFRRPWCKRCVCWADSCPPPPPPGDSRPRGMFRRLHYLKRMFLRHRDLTEEFQWASKMLRRIVLFAPTWALVGTAPKIMFRRIRWVTDFMNVSTSGEGGRMLGRVAFADTSKHFTARQRKYTNYVVTSLGARRRRNISTRRIFWLGVETFQDVSTSGDGYNVETF